MTKPDRVSRKFQNQEIQPIDFSHYLFLELRRLRNNMAEVDEEMTLMETEAKIKSETHTVWSVLVDPKMLLPIVLACALQGGSQLAGITAVFSYSVSIFESAGLTSANAKYATLGAGFINFLMTCLGPFIMARYDRRPTLLISCFGSGVFLVILAFLVRFIVNWKIRQCAVILTG